MHHVSVTSDGSIWIIYLDGIVESLSILGGENSGEWFADNDNGVAVYSIGKRPDVAVGDPSNFDGMIDEVRIYNRALSADEIQQLYNQKKPIFHLKMDEGSGTTVHDSSGNEHHGTLNE